MRRASSRVLTSPTSRRSPSQIANSAIDADSGIGKKYVPSSTKLVLLRNTCSTCVVATCELILVSILIDRMGSDRGRFIGLSTIGGVGQRRHGPGTMTPWALATDMIPKLMAKRTTTRMRLAGNRIRISTQKID